MNAKHVAILAILAVAVAGGVWFLAFRGEPQKPAQENADAKAAAKPEREFESVEVEPGYVPPKVTDEKLAPLVNRRFRTEERLRPDITSSIPEVTDPADLQTMVAVLKDTKDTDDVRNEVINLLRRSNYEGLSADLTGILERESESERFRAFVAQHLGMQADLVQPAEREKIQAVLRRALEDRHVAVRREALLALVRMLDEQGLETAVALLTKEGDEAEAMRDLAIRCVREQDLREHLPLVRKLAESPNENAKIAAMVTVSQWHDQESRPVLEKAAQSESLRVMRAAEAALKRLDAAKETAAK